MRRCTVVAALALLAPIGCGAPETVGTDDDPVGVTESSLLAHNGFTFNGFTFNGFTFNGFTFNGFTFNGFTFNGFTFNGLATDEALGRWNALSPQGLRDPATHALATYLISCALPEGESITYSDANGTFRFDGEIGLAPAWKGDRCDGDCQRWISACLVARSNASGEHVKISIRGPSKALALDPGEARDFRAREATYYGNIFGENPAVYACLSPGVTTNPRVCGPSMSDCPMTVTGSCDDVCDRRGGHGTFVDCRPGSRKDGKRDRRSFEQTITVFLPQ